MTRTLPAAGARHRGAQFWNAIEGNRAVWGWQQGAHELVPDLTLRSPQASWLELVGVNTYALGAVTEVGGGLQDGAESCFRGVRGSPEPRQCSGKFSQTLR